MGIDKNRKYGRAHLRIEYIDCIESSFADKNILETPLLNCIFVLFLDGLSLLRIFLKF